MCSWSSSRGPRGRSGGLRRGDRRGPPSAEGGCPVRDGARARRSHRGGARAASLTISPSARAKGRPGRASPGTIGFSVVRGGAIVGDHSVMFIGPRSSSSCRTTRSTGAHSRTARCARRAGSRAARRACTRWPTCLALTGAAEFARLRQAARDALQFAPEHPTLFECYAGWAARLAAVPLRLCEARFP